ncbi:hypothetical protein BaRGS_00034088 [Batillaria attramentaria]|uniref:Uncharacterized protein n=1 Tax=Batillaria attramentaria TaxID=370345 RepID=A0ABD0JI94_9CAEN
MDSNKVGRADTVEHRDVTGIHQLRKKSYPRQGLLKQMVQHLPTYRKKAGTSWLNPEVAHDKQHLPLSIWFPCRLGHGAELTPPHFLPTGLRVHPFVFCPVCVPFELWREEFVPLFLPTFGR